MDFIETNFVFNLLEMNCIRLRGQMTQTFSVTSYTLFRQPGPSVVKKKTIGKQQIFTLMHMLFLEKEADTGQTKNKAMLFYWIKTTRKTSADLDETNIQTNQQTKKWPKYKRKFLEPFHDWLNSTILGEIFSYLSTTHIALFHIIKSQ